MSEQENLKIPQKQFETPPQFDGKGDNFYSPEKKQEFLAKQTGKIEQAKASQAQAIINSQSVSPQFKTDDSSIVLQKVEDILAKNMEHVFLSMDAASQEAFKQKGEETAQKISLLFGKAKIKFGEVLELIINWLKIIPKVNNYYLEQEAKIKTDEIIKLHSKR